MLAVYLLIEMQALCFYVLASFKRNSAFSIDAGLKYFISGAFISGIFLCGCSIIYGSLGTLNLNSINLLLSFPIENLVLSNFINIGVILITISLLFKVSAVPFHFWSPDVYEGAPISSTLIFSILPKLSFFTFFIKWLLVSSANNEFTNVFLLIIGLLSTLIGAFFAIHQKRIKRLVIFSSIAQTGFIITALYNLNSFSVISIYFFIIIYLITSIVIWSKIILLYDFNYKITSFFLRVAKPLFISNLSNLYKVNPLWSILFIITMFSVAGIPPLSGFLAKFFIILSLIENNQILGGLLLIIISSISVFYYLRVLKIIFFESSQNNKNFKEFQVIFVSSETHLNSLIITSGVLTLFYLFINPALLLLLCHNITLGCFFF